MGRAETLTKHLKRHDCELFASCGPTGVVFVCRNNRGKPHEPHFIFALTDNWSMKGEPRDWGIEPVLNRIKAMDLWRDDSFVENFIKEHDKKTESDDRARRSDMESFLIEFRRQFARATNDINTATMQKIDSRRTGDLKHGR